MSRQSAENLFSTGRLIQANSPEGVAISTGYDLEPGGTRVGVVRIANGDARLRNLRLFELDASSDFGKGQLALEVTEARGSLPVVLFSGEVGELSSDGLDLGTFEPGEARTYCLTLTCASDAVGASIDRVAGAAYEWRAEADGIGEVGVGDIDGPAGLLRPSSCSGAVLLAGPDLRPGESRSGEVTISNLGTRPASFRMFECHAASGFAAGCLGLTVHELADAGVRRLYLGEVGSVGDAGIDLGSFEAGESRTYRFTVLLASSTPEQELGKAVGATYDWLATPAGGR